jgi:hypothetical protein
MTKMQQSKLDGCWSGESNPWVIQKWAPLKWNAAFHLSAWRALIGSWRNKHQIHANWRQGRSNHVLEMIFKHSSRVLAVHHQHEQNLTEINETYMDRILSSCTTLIQHSFQLISLIAKGSSKTSFTIQNSNQHN